jgi:hypothetical protein
VGDVRALLCIPIPRRRESFENLSKIPHQSEGRMCSSKVPRFRRYGVRQPKRTSDQPLLAGLIHRLQAPADAKFFIDTMGMDFDGSQAD